MTFPEKRAYGRILVLFLITADVGKTKQGSHTIYLLKLNSIGYIRARKLNNIGYIRVAPIML